MEVGTFIAIVALGGATYLLRVLPLVLAVKAQDTRVDRAPLASLLEKIGPMLICSLLAVSLTPSGGHWGFNYGATVAVGLVATFFGYKATRNLGISVVVGVLFYGLSFLSLGS